MKTIHISMPGLLICVLFSVGILSQTFTEKGTTVTLYKNNDLPHIHSKKNEEIPAIYHLKTNRKLVHFNQLLKVKEGHVFGLKQKSYSTITKSHLQKSLDHGSNFPDTYYEQHTTSLSPSEINIGNHYNHEVNNLSSNTGGNINKLCTTQHKLLITQFTYRNIAYLFSNISKYTALS